VGVKKAEKIQTGFWGCKISSPALQEENR